MTSTENRAAALLALHHAPEVLVLANVGDVVSALQDAAAAVVGGGTLPAGTRTLS